MHLTSLIAIGVGAAIITVNSVRAQEWLPTGAPVENWKSLCCSADGKTLIGAAWGNRIQASSDSGLTWTLTTLPSGGYQAISCNANGALVLAAEAWNGPIYKSTNNGVTWAVTSAPLRPWQCVTSSAEGMRLFAADGQAMGQLAGVGQIYASNDSGISWLGMGSPQEAWSSLTTSADGHFVAGAIGYPGGQYGLIYASTNSGNIWSSGNTQTNYWAGIACSADGTRLIAAVDWGGVFISTNSGAVWSQSAAPVTNWLSVASSADGIRLAASGYGFIYTSSNAGQSWQPAALATKYGTNGIFLASSADGGKLFAAEFSDTIYVYSNTPSPSLASQPSNTGLVLSWLIPSTRFVLQESPSVVQPQWSDVGVQPILNLTNLNQEVAVRATASARFYRLISR